TSHPADGDPSLRIALILSTTDEWAAVEGLTATECLSILFRTGVVEALAFTTALKVSLEGRPVRAHCVLCKARVRQDVLERVDVECPAECGTGAEDAARRLLDDGIEEVAPHSGLPEARIVLHDLLNRRVDEAELIGNATVWCVDLV